MHGKDSELEIIVITEAVDLSLDSLDLVVDTFHFSARNPIVIICQDTVRVKFDCVSQLLYLLLSAHFYEEPENLGTTPLLGTFPSYLSDVVFSPRKSLRAVFSLGLTETVVDEIIRETLAYVKNFCVLYSLRS